MIRTVRSAREHGHASVEYVGATLVVLLIVLGVMGVSAAVGHSLGDRVRLAVCELVDRACAPVAVASHGADPPGRIDASRAGAAGPDSALAADDPASGGGTSTTEADGGGAGRPAVAELTGGEPTGTALDHLGADASPREVAEVFGQMSPADRQRLLHEHAALVGALDGAPLDLRYAANRQAMAEAARTQEAEAGRLRLALEQAPVWRPFLRRSLRAELEQAERRAEQLRGWADSDRLFLLFDPAGDGRVAEVLGDLETADHVAYFVPGVGSTIDNFDDATRVYAERLHTQIADDAPASGAAVIAWLGYDPPERVASVAAARADRAEGAARTLPGFVEGVRAHSEGAQVTVIGHSYGSVATSLAAQDGMEVDDIVLIGSPGARASTAQDLGARVWVGLTPDDPIRRAPNRTVGGAGHGTDPADSDFGATVFDTGDASGHSGYLDIDTMSAMNIAAIVTGRHDEVVPR